MTTPDQPHHSPPSTHPADTLPTEHVVPGAPVGDAILRAPWWQPHRRLYNWVLSLANRKHASTALFALSFAESSFFPVPPDVLQIALTLERRDKAWRFAAVSTIGSVLGGIAGYYIGVLAWDAIGPFFFDHIPGFTHAHFDLVRDRYDAHALLAILTAAFTPIPFKVFTITAGVFSVSLPVLIVGSIIGRAARFYLVAAIIWKFGPPAKRFVDKYFNLLTLVFMVLLIAGVLILKGVGGPHTTDDKPATPPETPAPTEQ